MNVEKLARLIRGAVEYVEIEPLHRRHVLQHRLEHVADTKGADRVALDFGAPLRDGIFSKRFVDRPDEQKRPLIVLAEQAKWR